MCWALGLGFWVEGVGSDSGCGLGVEIRCRVCNLELGV